MEFWLERSEKLFGKERIERLAHSRVAVFGLGGVGGYVMEALVRSGVGMLDLIDNDTVSVSNLNRQIIALHSTLGQKKTEAAAHRLLDINPKLKLHLHDCFFLPETAESFDFTAYDYIVDAIDTVKGKIALAVQAALADTPILSSMGFANKMDPTRIRVTDIYKTSVCPLAKAMRTGLRKAGINRLKVVFSDEPPLCAAENERSENGQRVIGSNAFVPAAAGLIMAAEVIKDLAGD
ncbi:MAG: tRNA threonylcarbamoyladenosine dehydratase [Clostridiales bacterium]|nr:tRNA threonylcarbamoyladenosine dehydratase [Clostridiales bacterium]